MLHAKEGSFFQFVVAFALMIVCLIVILFIVTPPPSPPPPQPSDSVDEGFVDGENNSNTDEVNIQISIDFWLEIVLFSKSNIKFSKYAQ